MKAKILRIAILIVFLLFTFEGYSQFQNWTNQLKEAEITTDNLVAPEGKVVTITVHSPGLVGNILGDSPDRPVSVYLPPGYDNHPEQHYPVIYLLAGYGLKHDLWFGGLVTAYNHKFMLDPLINEGTLKPVIVVSPDNYNKYEGSWFTNSSLAGNWEDFNAIDLVKSIDENFRTIQKPESRGIAGYSMGGYGAVMIAMKYPETFSTLYSISGALIDFQHRLINLEEEKKAFTVASNLTSFNTSSVGEFSIAIAFAPDKNAVGFGEMPVDKNGVVIDSVWQKYLAHDLASKIPDFKQNLLKLNKIVLECGTGEPPIHNENSSFSKILNENGISHTLNVHNGDHAYTVNNRMDSHVYPFFSENLHIAMVELQNSPCLSNTDTVITQFNIDGTLYIVPNKTLNNKDNIISSQLKSIITQAFEEVKIPLDSFENGVYKIIGISNDGFISSPVGFSVEMGTPHITILATDLMTGEPLENCQATFNEELLKTNEEGLILLENCGMHFAKFNMDNYYTEKVNFNIYCDTTLVLTMVHDSYVKLVDRSSGKVIPNASVTQMAVTANSGSNGIAKVQNLRNSTLIYEISNSRYFPEEGTTHLNPGDTTVIELTSKRASVEIIVKNESGSLANQNVVFNGKTVLTNEEGSAVFSNVNARKKYEYSLEASSYKTIQDSVFIELDTIIQIMLEPVTSAEDLISPDFTIYPNPFNDELFIQTNTNREYSVELATITGRTIYRAKTEGNFHRINLKEFSSGIYFVRMKSDNFMSVKKVIKR